MHKVLFISFVFILILSWVYDSKSNENNSTIHNDIYRYYHLKCILREKGQSQYGYYFLIQNLTYPQEFTELNSHNWKGLAGTFLPSNNNGSILYYSKNVGDTLYFEYINKDRFWKKR